MARINDDVLRLLLDYVPQDSLHAMATVHPVFHDALMASRYAAVCLDKRDKRTKRLLDHLSQEWVGRHVKSVAIKPWLVDPRTKSPRSKTENAITRCMELLDPHYTQKKVAQRLQKRLGKDVDRVRDAFKVMTNVQEFIIEWDGDANYHPEFYQAFVIPPLEAWSSHLNSLSICLPPSSFNSLARIRLPHLQSLSVHFITGNLSESETKHIYDGFAVFINNLKDTITSLKISSASSSLNLDLSRIFRRMGTFPKLRQITLSIPFDGGHLPDPMAFVNFVSKHRFSLKDLSITTSRCTVHNKSGDPEHVNWIQQILSSFTNPFPLLATSEVALRPLRVPLNIFGDFLDMHSTTLQSISLVDRGLDGGDLERLFTITAPSMAWEGMHDLRFKAQTVSAGLLTCIARLFPQLKSCTIESAAIDFEQPFFEARPSPSTKSSVSRLAEYRNIARDRRALSDWGLGRLVITFPSNLLASTKGQSQMRLLKHELAFYLPALKTTMLCTL